MRILISYFYQVRNFKPYIYNEEETIKIFNSIDNGYLKVNSKPTYGLVVYFNQKFRNKNTKKVDFSTL